jgi:hypothetical protein
VLKNVTITLEEDVARWVRLKAAAQQTSVAKFVGRMLQREMQVGGEYDKAFDRAKKLSRKGLPLGSRNRPSREELHERRTG